MTQSEATELLRHIVMLEHLLEWGDCDEERVKGELEEAREHFATGWIGG